MAVPRSGRNPKSRVAVGSSSAVEFGLLLVIFAAVYFGLCLPAFQLISRRTRGRKFVVRLGTPWKASDPEHRWDVLMSFLSFVAALALSMYLLDLLLPFGNR